MDVDKSTGRVEGVAFPMNCGFVEISYDEKGNSKESLVDLDRFRYQVNEYETIYNEKGEKIEEIHHLPHGIDRIIKYADGEIIDSSYVHKEDVSRKDISKQDSESDNETRIDKTQENDTDSSDKDDSVTNDKDEWNDNSDDFEDEYDPVA